VNDWGFVVLGWWLVVYIYVNTHFCIRDFHQFSIGNSLASGISRASGTETCGEMMGEDGDCDISVRA